MKKIKLISMMFLIMIMIPTIVLADDSYNTIAKVSNSLLAALSWVGYAVALGMLLFIGIKYVMSGANEKANLKGKLVTYVVGIGLIGFCSTIAAAVAGIANKDGKNDAVDSGGVIPYDGKNDAGGIIDRGFELGNIQVQTAPTGGNTGGGGTGGGGQSPTGGAGGRPGTGANAFQQAQM